MSLHPSSFLGLGCNTSHLGLANVKTHFFFISYKSYLTNAIATRTVRGSDYSPAVELSEQKEKLVTAFGDTENYSETQANNVWLNSVH